MREPALLSALLLLPILAMAINFIPRNKDIVRHQEPRSLVQYRALWPMALFSVVAAILEKRLNAPLTFTILTFFPILLFAPADDRTDPLLQSRRLSSLLTCFFAAGFLISPDPLWALIFWEGFLTSLLLSGTFGKIALSNDISRISGFPAPILASAILFPLSLWLSGTLPGQHLHISLISFMTGIVSLGLLLPAAPFMKWLYLFPDDRVAVQTLFQRVAISLVATDGICRFVLPQEALSGKSFLFFQDHLTTFATILLIPILLAQLQGLAIAWSEPVLFRRMAYLIFSQSTLLPAAILLGGVHRTTILTLLAVSLIVCSITIALPLIHIERQTRHRTLSTLGGLLINMPRTGLLMALASLAFSGFPGFSLASAFSFFPFGSWRLSYLFLSLLMVTATGVLLGRTMGNLFLGEEPKASYRPRDLSAVSFALGVLLLIPLSFLAFYPPDGTSGVFSQSPLSHKTGSAK